MIIAGIDTSAVPSQFENAVPGRTLILDGDGPCYVVAATTKRMDTAIRRFQSEVLRCMFLSKAEDCTVHLTAHNSDKHGRFRVIAEQPYQGNRKNKDKPSLLEPLREAMADRSNWLPEFNEVILHRKLEADDGMIQQAYGLGERGVVWSEDKDLRMTPYPYYEQKTGTVSPSVKGAGELWLVQKTASQVLAGRGRLFFWGQMLCGDQADHVKGIREVDGKKCGSVGAYDLLKSVGNDENKAANTVIDLYRAIDQNVVAEGWLLWLLRTEGDNVLKYMLSLNLTGINRDYVQSCAFRSWVLPKDEKEENDFN
jgi:hypothetical protein